MTRRRWIRHPVSGHAWATPTCGAEPANLRTITSTCFRMRRERSTMRRHSGRFGVALVVALLAVAIAIPTALADSPHFISASASIDNSGNLVCSFKEAGLGTTLATEHVSCSADATAVYACINGGDNHPKAANKETVSGPVSGGGDFPVRNGQTTGSITVAPPGPGGFSCPNGQRLVLASISYTNIMLTGLAGDTANVPGTISKTFFNI